MVCNTEPRRLSGKNEIGESMHQSGMSLMVDFVKQYKLESACVVDMGSCDVRVRPIIKNFEIVNDDVYGNYRCLFPKGKYIGADISSGKNVDVIVGSKEWAEIKDVDAVISGQALEHVADIPKFFADIYKVLKPGGVICIIAPSKGPAHYYPLWAGHFSVERMSEVVKAGGFEIIECKSCDTGQWKDTRCIATKK